MKMRLYNGTNTFKNGKRKNRVRADTRVRDPSGTMHVTVISRLNRKNTTHGIFRSSDEAGGRELIHIYRR